jgi:hypothetical protein
MDSWQREKPALGVANALLERRWLGPELELQCSDASLGVFHAHVRLELRRASFGPPQPRLHATGVLRTVPREGGLLLD